MTVTWLDMKDLLKVARSTGKVVTNMIVAQLPLPQKQHSAGPGNGLLEKRKWSDKMYRTFRDRGTIVGGYFLIAVPCCKIRSLENIFP